ncbi:hypothetical protein VB715_18585 [Crocosphaera sp. UHCC 0190]|uniref:hypothetical protein n=1 Tax=Crocosphaera sp. UHCC 0190 TaxID=3110246 RepID=UPI002B1F349C|nr:hypothetical protein [Crocosphaera sp. UHCC 0190]MEA5511783.1 hypothetical protein [Crocosphaera sp. UHCC 0190]
MTIGMWERIIMNGYEPDNTIRIWAELSEDDKWEFIEIEGFLSFRDGSSHVCIRRTDEGFDWKNDDQKGIAKSFEEAWAKMPGFVTHPDEYEDGEIIKL